MLKGPKRSFVVLGVESSKEIVPNETKSGHEEDLPIMNKKQWCGDSKFEPSQGGQFSYFIFNNDS